MFSIVHNLVICRDIYSSNFLTLVAVQIMLLDISVNCMYVPIYENVFQYITLINKGMIEIVCNKCNTVCNAVYQVITS